MKVQFFVFAQLIAVSIAFGQESGKPDRFTIMQACVDAVKSGNFSNYSPSFLSGHREPGDGEELRGLEERACVKLHIVGGRAFVPQAKGEKYIFAGQQLKARYDCGNDAGEIEYVPVEVAVVIQPPAAPPVLQPAPEPQPEPEPEVHMPPMAIPEELIAMPPALGPAPSRNYVATLLWNGKKWYWTWTPLWCVDVHSKKDLYKPAVCAAAAVGGYWLAGGFHATALYKAVACVTTLLPNGTKSTCP